MPGGRTSAWRRLTLGSERVISQSGRRPISTGSSPSADALAVGQHQGAGADAAAALVEAADDVKRPGSELVVEGQLDLHRAHERVPLVAGVLPGGVAQLAHEGLVDLGEGGVVLRDKREGEVVGDDGAALARRPSGGRPSPGPAAVPARSGAGCCGRRGRTRPRPYAPSRARTLASPWRDQRTGRRQRDWGRRGAAVACSRSLGRVAELADAQDSGSCVRKDVGVQVPPRPLVVVGLTTTTTWSCSTGPVRPQAGLGSSSNSKSAARNVTVNHRKNES